MTICISAICTENNEENIAIAMDNMITTGIDEFEHDINKYELLSDSTVGIIAGNVLLMDYFLDDDEYLQMSYCEIQTSIYEKFKQKRSEKIQNEILDVYSIDREYVKELLKNPISNEYQSLILKRILKTNLNTAILLLGFENNKAKITEIVDTGIIDYGKINFHTIGSGSIQAQNTLLFQKHSKQDDLKTTLYNVYKAKKNAEVMQGVGRKTDIGFLNQNGLQMLDGDNIEILDKIYYAELNCGKKHKLFNDLNF